LHLQNYQSGFWQP